MITSSDCDRTLKRLTETGDHVIIPLSPVIYFIYEKKAVKKIIIMDRNLCSQPEGALKIFSYNSSQENNKSNSNYLIRNFKLKSWNT